MIDDLSKLHSKKGVNINEIGYGSSVVKPVTQADLKNKVKGVHGNPSEDEKKNCKT